MDCAEGRVNERIINIIRVAKVVGFLKPSLDLYFL